MPAYVRCGPDEEPRPVSPECFEAGRLAYETGTPIPAECRSYFEEPCMPVTDCSHLPSPETCKDIYPGQAWPSIVACQALRAAAIASCRANIDPNPWEQFPDPPPMIPDLPTSPTTPPVLAGMPGWLGLVLLGTVTYYVARRF